MTQHSPAFGNDNLILQLVPQIQMDSFADCQFLREPRLRLLQQAYHSLQRSKRKWALSGTLGGQARAVEISLFGLKPTVHLSELLSKAHLPRATLHPYQQDQIMLGLSTVQHLANVVTAYGHPCDYDCVPTDQPALCGMRAGTLPLRIHVHDDAVWVYRPFEPANDAHQPISFIHSLTASGMPIGQGAGAGQSDASSRIAHHTVLYRMEIGSEQAMRRAIEAIELGAWALRQPPYTPAGDHEGALSENGGTGAGTGAGEERPNG